MPASDLERFAVFLDMALTSNQKGEIENALSKARKTGLRVSDLVAVVGERDRALDVAKQAIARLDRAEAENKRLRAQRNGSTTVGGLAARLWQDAGTITTVSRKSAEWVLDLIARDLFQLKATDLDFVQSCTRWARPFTAGQESWLLDIVRRAAKATGESPP
jgi:hypothetical protein